MDFYRGLSTSLYAAGPLKRLLGNRKLLFGLIVGGAVAGYITFGSHGVIQRVRLQRQSAELERKIHEAEEEAKALQNQSKTLDTDKRAIEKVAREKYGMARPGESVYKVKKDER